MAKNEKKIDINDVLKEKVIMNIKLIGVKKFKLKLFIAMKLIKFANFILGCNVEIITDDNKPPLKA